MKAFGLRSSQIYGQPRCQWCLQISFSVYPVTNPAGLSHHPFTKIDAGGVNMRPPCYHSRALTSSAAIKMFSISASRLKRTEHNSVTVEPPSISASLEMFVDINELLPTSTLHLTPALILHLAYKPGAFLLRWEI